MISFGGRGPGKGCGVLVSVANICVDGVNEFADTGHGEAAELAVVEFAEAAAEAVENVRALNRERRAADWPAMELDIALHLGDVLYGNVGAGDRLDFTVIGPAVNEASRIEALCTPLGHNILISEAFAKAAERSVLRAAIVP